MPSKIKYGIEYFPQDVKHYDDIKSRKATRDGGCLPMSIYDRMTAGMYHTGHYHQFDSLSDLYFTIFEKVNEKEEDIAKAVKILLEHKLFDVESFEKGYLTSKDIQKKYYGITKRRKVRYLDECWLLTEQEMNEIDNKNPKEVENSNLTLVNKNQVKVNTSEHDVNKSRVEVDSCRHDVNKNEVLPKTSKPNSTTKSTPVNRSQQSKSNTKTKTKSNKERLMINKKTAQSINLPSGTDSYTRTFYEQGLLEYNELEREVLDEFYTYCKKEYKFKEIFDATAYTRRRIKENGWLDSNGNPIVNKIAYIQYAIINNIHAVIRNEEDKKDPTPYLEKLLRDFPGLKNLSLD